MIIEGGVDTASPDRGIRITGMRPGGAAASDGRLKLGDEILYIGRHCMCGVTHDRAVTVFVDELRDEETSSLKVTLAR